MMSKCARPRQRRRRNASKTRHASGALKRRQIKPLGLEPLEERTMFAVDPITLAAFERFGLSASDGSHSVSASKDGQVIAFQSDAPDLVIHDTNGAADVFAYFPATGQIELVSVNADGTNGGNFHSRNPKVSPDGRYVLFESSSNNIIPGVFSQQLYGRDLQTGRTILVSANDAGEYANGGAGDASWNAAGDKVVFESGANNLVADDTNGQMDIFVRDLVAQTTVRASVAQDGTQANARSFDGRLSGDGRFVVFASYADNLGPADATTIEDIYVKDLQTGEVDLVSIDTLGINQTNVHPYLSSRPISDDGRFVLFESASTSIGPPSAAFRKVFLRDRVNATTTVVSVAADGVTPHHGTLGVISPDGRHVAFVSGSPDLDPDVTDNNNAADVFVRDLTAGTTRLVSASAGGTSSGNGSSGFPNQFTGAEPIVSGDGQKVVFHSFAANLTNTPDTGGVLNLFLRDLQTGTTTSLSSRGDERSLDAAVSADFSTVAFETLAGNLVAGDQNDRVDVVIKDLSSGATSLVSRRNPLFPREKLAGGGLVSATPDGRYVGFNSGPSIDLAPGVSFRGFQTSSAYVRDRKTGEIKVVDLTPDPTISGGGFNPILTPDGRFAAFTARQPTGGSPPLVDGITFVGPVGGFFGADVYLRDLEAGVTRIVSVDPSGQSSTNGYAGGEVKISNNARYIAFTSNGDNLVDGLSNPDNHMAIYLRDMWTNTTILVSRNLAGDGAISGRSFNLNMTPDGRYITFTSEASDLAANDANDKPDVFRFDRDTGKLSLVSINKNGDGSADNDSGGAAGFRPVMTPDGRYIAFASRAADLDPDITIAKNQANVFVRDMETERTHLVSVNQDRTGGGNFQSRYPSITPDGKTVVFLSAANNLTDTPRPVFGDQIFARDLEHEETRLISMNAAGDAAANGAFDEPTISPSGRYVAFRSLATDLVDNFVEGNAAFQGDVFVRDLNAGTNYLATYNESGTAGGSGANTGFRFLFVGENTLLFDTNSPDIFPGDRNNAHDVFSYTIGGSGQIQGTVFDDANGNSLRDVSEEGLSGVPVWIDANSNRRLDIGETRVQTDSEGDYAFTNLPAGDYNIAVQIPVGLQSSSQIRRFVNLPTDSSIAAENDFGLIGAAADLVVSGVNAPPVVDAGRPFDVTWTVRNVSDSPISGDWQDAVYLSSDNQLDGGDMLLGAIPHSGGLDALSSYSKTISMAAPPTLTGNYFVFVQTDRRNQVAADTNRENNLAVGFNPLSVAIPELAVGTPLAEQFTGANQSLYYRMTPTASGPLTISFDSLAANGEVDLYLRRAAPPTPYDFQQASRLTGPDKQLTVPIVSAGAPYYILAQSRSGAAATGLFTITAEQSTQLELASISPSQAGNFGRATFAIHGANFTASTTASLHRGATTLDALEVDYQDPTLLYATFDLDGKTPADYDLHLTDGGQLATKAAALKIVQADIQPLDIKVIPPAGVRAGRSAPVIIEYHNRGNTFITSPIIEVRVDPAMATLHFQEQRDPQGPVARFLAISHSGPAGMLAPGEKGQLAVELTSLTTNPSDQIRVEAGLVDPAEVLDWEQLRDLLTSSHFDAQGWNAVWENVTQMVGTTMEDFNSLMADLATYLNQLGVATADSDRLWSFLISLANNAVLRLTLDGAIDVVSPAPGLPLNVERYFSSSILDRNTQGMLGRGWNTFWDTRLELGEHDMVLIHRGAQAQVFAPIGQGLYQGLRGDRSVLRKSGDMYILQDEAGYETAFDADGKLRFLEDTAGNRITAGYDPQQRLVTLTHSNGDTLSLSYNSQNRVNQAIDAEGQTADYQYDAAGEHLLRVTTAAGVTEYGYLVGQGARREHALTSIKRPGGLETRFTYDERGRVTGRLGSSGATPVTISYADAGEVHITGGAGGDARIFLNDLGQVEKVRDALGREIQADYELENLTRLVSPSGHAMEMQYDGLGNLLSQTNSLGGVTQFAWKSEGAPSRLASLTDARGVTTQYDYNLQDLLGQIEYADSSQAQYSYDASGNLIQYVNRRGQTIRLEYNAQGLPVRRILPDNSVVEFGYDAHHNLTSITDSRGEITAQYDSADRLEQIRFPGGRSLTFAYDSAGRRIRSVDQDGFTVKYVWSSSGQLERMEDENDQLIVAYQYDSAGRMSRRELGNGAFTEYDYNEAGQLVSLRNHAPGGEVNSWFDYTYNADGLRDGMTTQNGTTRYRYDALGQLVAAETPTATFEYEYDLAGNRIRMIVDGATVDFTANELNQIVSIGGAAAVYDNDGNLISLDQNGQTTSYAYDALNRLTSIQSPAGVFQYEYDPLGNRVAAKRNGVRTEYLFDPVGLGNLVGEYDVAGNQVAAYTHGLGLVARHDGAGDRWYDFDAIGSTVGLMNEAGDYVNQYAYDPFGEVLAASETTPNHFRFVGQQGVIDDGALTHMRARHYLSGAGQFTSEDPLNILAGDWNIRRYAGNNPINATDPTGLYTAISAGAFQGLGGQGTFTFAPNGDIFFTAAVGAGFGASGAVTFGSGTVSEGWGGTLSGSLGIFTGNTNFDGSGVTSADLGPSVGPLKGCICGTYTVKLPVKNNSGHQAPCLDDVVGGAANWVFGFIPNFNSKDPNDITGPRGIGDENWITEDRVLPYTIRFENDPDNATAPAQEVVVTHNLDADLDWSSFEFGDVGFGAAVIDVPQGLQSYQTTMDYQNLDGSPLLVDVAMNLDLSIGQVAWSFRSIDPNTGLLPAGVFDGFLPPNDDTGRGEGFMRYMIRPQQNLTSGTTIDQQASIVFDTNDAILTNIFTNAIDGDAPISQVNSLPVEQNLRSFSVSWSGDDGAGSGVAGYDVYVSVDGEAFDLWLDDTGQTEAVYTGQFGHTYSFYSVATDLLGLNEPALNSGQATTSLVDLATVDFVNGAIIVTGGPDYDHIYFFQDLSPTDISVNVNGRLFRHFDSPSKLIAHGNGGEDRISVQYITGMPPAEFHGGDDNDRLYGGWNDDLLIGDDGRDLLLGAYGQDRLEGGPGNDVLRGQSHDDIIFGGDGRDILDGGRGNDILRGGAGGDLLRGSFGNDILLGEEDRDRLYGNVGRNLLLGGAARDRLQASDDGDLLISGPTAYDNNDQALQAILAEWSSNRTLGQRVANLTAGVGGASGNDYALILGATVFNDNQWTYLIGGGEEDWFFKYRKDILIDLDPDVDHVTQ